VTTKELDTRGKEVGIIRSETLSVLKALAIKEGKGRGLAVSLMTVGRACPSIHFLKPWEAHAQRASDAFFFFPVVVLAFELRASCLLGRC
jgi:hypothetical protein